MQQTQSAHRMQLDQRDRESQQAAQQFADNAQNAAARHAEEVSRLTKLNLDQQERNAAETKKRDSDYNTSLENLRQKHAQEMKQAGDDRHASVSALQHDLTCQQHQH